MIANFTWGGYNVMSHPLNFHLTEVNISPKISISAHPLKMALHRNPAMHGLLGHSVMSKVKVTDLVSE